MMDLIIPEGELDLDVIAAKMLQFEQADCPVIHRFSPGLYIREVRVPSDTLAIGHYQKCEHLNLFLQGKVLMYNEDGTKTELTAPMIFTAPPGRKMGYVIDEMVWLNIYPTQETDVETLEETYLDKNVTWQEHKKLMDTIKANDRISDIEDYKALISDYGLTEEDVRKETEDETDQVPIPAGDYKFLISNSNIEGKGVFASASIDPGEIIGPANVDGKRTPLGRYCNHSMQPNAKMIRIGNDIFLAAISEIPGCRGGLNGEEITTDYRKNLKLIGREPCREYIQQ